MKIPYITLAFDHFVNKLVIGFGLYDTKIKGCILWCDRLKDFIYLAKHEYKK